MAMWANRVTRTEMVDPNQLMAHPENAKIHPQSQQKQMRAVFERVGWIGGVKVSERTGRLLDGHMRVQMAITDGQLVPVEYFDLTPDEERVVLATYDGVGGQALLDRDMYDDLIAQIPDPDEQLVRLFAAVRGVSVDLNKTGGDDDPGDPEVAEDFVYGMVGWLETKVRCTADEIAALSDLHGRYRADNGGQEKGFIEWLTKDRG